MLDTHQLAVFLVAAETLNFSKAAERLHMSQPSVTQHVHSLEAHFNVPLFIRSNRRLSLTEGGLALLPLARQMVDLSASTELRMASINKEIHGKLEIGCTTTPGKYVLPALLAAFLKRYPRIRASVQVTSRQHAWHMLGAGEIQIAISSTIEFNSGIDFYRFFTEPIVLIAPFDHPWAKRENITLPEIQEGNYILREEKSGTYAVVRDGLWRVGINIQSLKTVLTLGNSEAIAFAVQEGIGVGFVSQIVATRIVSGKVAIVPISGLELFQDIYLGKNSQGPNTPILTAFWNFSTYYLSDNKLLQR